MFFVRAPLVAIAYGLAFVIITGFGHPEPEALVTAVELGALWGVTYAWLYTRKPGRSNDRRYLCGVAASAVICLASIVLKPRASTDLVDIMFLGMLSLVLGLTARLPGLERPLGPDDTPAAT